MGNEGKLFLPSITAILPVRDFLIKNLLKITKDEGVKALYKGLPVTLIGTIPARFIYFGAYNTTKSSFGTNEKHVHMLSAMSASVSQIIGMQLVLKSNM